MRATAIAISICLTACAGEPCPTDPMVVDMTRSNFSPGPVSEAALMWNRAMGREVVRLSDAGSIRVYKVYSIDIAGCDGVAACAVADVGLDGVIRSCDIYATPQATARVLAHELGHCAGLPHDDIPGSIMQTGTQWADGIVQEHIDHFEACAER